MTYHEVGGVAGAPHDLGHACHVARNAGEPANLVIVVVDLGGGIDDVHVNGGASGLDRTPGRGAELGGRR